jgi:ABC-2 type transport system ATP-binding protein
VLDEPVASLDPLARREFLRGLMEAAVETELSVLLSSHLVSDLERTCDYLVLLDRGTVRLAATLETVMATHRRLTGPRTEPSHTCRRTSTW